MKSVTVLIIFLFIINLNAHAQIIDSAASKKLTINGFCLCQTTLSDLQKSNNDLKEVEVEEMILTSNCHSQDSRFIAGKGFFSEKQPGLIFQKDQISDYISKIRLTKDFKGKLPDGNFVDIGKLRLSDLLKLYPQLKNNGDQEGVQIIGIFLMIQFPFM